MNDLYISEFAAALKQRIGQDFRLIDRAAYRHPVARLHDFHRLFRCSQLPFVFFLPIHRNLASRSPFS